MLNLFDPATQKDAATEKAIAHKIGHIIAGGGTAFLFSIAHHPICGLFAVAGLAIGKEWGDYMHGEALKSCLLDLAITVGAGVVGVLVGKL